MKSLYSCIAFTILIANSAGLSLSTDSGPADLARGCCRFFSDSDFMGESKEICNTISPFPIKYRLDKFWDNNIESWQCGQNVVVQFCADVVTDSTLCKESKWSTYAGSLSSNRQMNLMNIVSNVFISRVDEIVFRFTTGFTNKDCSGLS